MVESPSEPAASAASKPAIPLRMILLDRFEVALLLCLFAAMFLRAYQDYQVHGLLYQLFPVVLSEGVALFFLLIRRQTPNVSTRPFDWVLAFAGSALPLLVGFISAGSTTTLFGYEFRAHQLFQPTGITIGIGLGLWLCGFIFQLWAKFTLGRNFGVVAANRGVVSYGPYQFVRHPMYCGYLFTHIGFMLANPTDFSLGLYTVAWAVQIARLLAEERLLSQDDLYVRYKQEVPYRLIPGVF